MKKITLVTGANRGIGEQITRQLAALEHHVIMGCRDVDAGKFAAAQIAGDIDVVAMDLSDTELLARQCEDIQDRFDTINGLVNNAAILTQGELADVSIDAFQQSLSVNLVAPALLIQTFMPAMNASGYGRIVNLSSGWGAFHEGLDGPVAYAVSKAGLNALTVKAARQAVGNVKVNAACPGWVRTQMGGEAADLTPEQGAETPVWLADLQEDGPNGGFFRKKQAIEW